MLLAAITKEFKLVFRDVHSVLILFAMPSVFIIIMSLALQDQFSEEGDASLVVYYSSADKSEYAERFVTSLSAGGRLELREAPGTLLPQDMLKVLGNESQVLLKIPENLFDLFQDDLNGVEPVTLFVNPNVDIRTRLLVESAVFEALAKTRWYFMYTPQLSAQAKTADFIAPSAVQAVYLASKPAAKKPTAVQQNVPAWLIFSMFFVVIPIATTLVTEKQQGTLGRLRAMNVPMGIFLATKALPYLLINQVQLLIMLLLGHYVVPLLGGDSLAIGGHYGALACMSLAVGISATGYALLVAVVAKTIEQATAIGGVGNILLGAIGGIMVPKFVMPEYMQEFTRISPMSWGLDGFLDILLYGNGISDIFTEVVMLLAFGALMFSLAIGLFKKQL